MVPPGDLDRVELERAEPVDDGQTLAGSGGQRARRREEMVERRGSGGRRRARAGSARARRRSSASWDRHARDDRSPRYVTGRGDYRGAASAATSRSISGIWVGLTRRLASSSVEPLDPVDLGKRLDAARSPAATPSRTCCSRRSPGRGRPRGAQAWTTLPPFWTMLPSSIGSPSGGGWPVSSSNSRRATADELLVAVGLALRDRPVAGVAVPEERTAGVGEQDLEPTAPRPEEQDAGARPWCHARQRSRTCDSPATPTARPAPSACDASTATIGDITSRRRRGMPEITLPEVKLPDIKLPDGFRDMTKDDIVQAVERSAAAEEHRAAGGRPVEGRAPRADHRPDAGPATPEPAHAARRPGSRRAAIAAVWWLVTSPTTGPRIRRAVDDLKSRMNGEEQRPRPLRRRDPSRQPRQSGQAPIASDPIPHRRHGRPAGTTPAGRSRCPGRSLGLTVATLRTRRGAVPVIRRGACSSCWRRAVRGSLTLRRLIPIIPLGITNDPSDGPEEHLETT